MAYGADVAVGSSMVFAASGASLALFTLANAGLWILTLDQPQGQLRIF